MPALVRALRGATTVESDSAEEILRRSAELVDALLARNDVARDDVISMLFSATPDLRTAFPATGARLHLGLDDVPLMTCQELGVEGSLPRCIRVLVHVYTERARADIRHVFLEGAVALRPDLANE